MRFVALVSGGKDSFFNIQHCIAQGHELVALANLYPSQNVDEIDSFMFQTVGHNLIEHYGECLAVPVYRKTICGGSKNQELEYSVTQDDEIEDLHELLLTVMAHHAIEAVSCGAILSQYQRTRVENVCGRLGLTTLAYLWQRDQLQLMTEMCQSGLDARLVKVAAIGLTDRDLGKSISEMLPKLIKLNQMYEVHICGEGGEFETIVFDSPLFKHKRLEIKEHEAVTDSRNDVSYLKLEVEVVTKETGSLATIPPPVLDEDSEKIYNNQKNRDGRKDFVPETSQDSPVSFKREINLVGGYLFISNMTLDESEPESALRTIISELGGLLLKHNLSFGNIQHVDLLVSNMGSFSTLNEVYSSVFTDYHLPPSRVCIETTIPNQISLSCSVLLERPKRLGVHVRSISYWAPHNIGPYSQSIVATTPTYKMATISGQIPLIPATMELAPSSDDAYNSILCIQHFRRVKEIVQVRHIGAAVCFVTENKVAPVASGAWRAYTTDIEGENCERLVTVQVSGLPKGANVELSGWTFEQVEAIDDDDVDERPEAQEKSRELPLSARSAMDRVHSSSFGDITIGVFFTSSDLKGLHDFDGHLQIFATDTPGVGFPENSLVVPVTAVWDPSGISYKYGGIFRIWGSTT